MWVVFGCGCVGKRTGCHPIKRKVVEGGAGGQRRHVKCGERSAGVRSAADLVWVVSDIGSRRKRKEEIDTCSGQPGLVFPLSIAKLDPMFAKSLGEPGAG